MSGFEFLQVALLVFGGFPACILICWLLGDPGAGLGLWMVWVIVLMVKAKRGTLRLYTREDLNTWRNMRRVKKYGARFTYHGGAGAALNNAREEWNGDPDALKNMSLHELAEEWRTTKAVFALSPGELPGVNNWTATDVSALDNRPGSFRAAWSACAGSIRAARLPVLLGDRVEDLATFPHMIIAGTTGSGKSCFLHTVLCGLMSARSPQTLRMCLCDPKRTELSLYKGPHLMRPTATEDAEILESLAAVVELIDRRYKEIAAQGLQSAPEEWPRVVVVVEEAAALLGRNKKAFLPPLERIAELGRAAGVHLILTAQRPDKATLGRVMLNVPMRVCFRVFSPVDARTVFGQASNATGADLLTSAGDGIYYHSTKSPDFVRFHSPLITAGEIKALQDTIQPR